MKFLSGIIEIMLLLVLWILTILLIIIPLLPLWIMMLIVKLLEKYFYNTLYNATKFSSEEIIWVYDNPNNRAIINGLVMLDGRVTIQKLQQTLSDKMVKALDNSGNRMYPRVTKYVHAGVFQYFWMDEEKFNIAEHVYEWSKEVITSENELQKLISQLAVSPLINERKKSPWEYILIHYKYGEKEKSAIFVRGHHSLADGVSIVYFLVTQLNEAPLIQKSFPKFSTISKWLLFTTSVLRIPLTSLKMAFLPAVKHDLHCRNVSGKKHLVWSEPIKLQTIKDIKTKLNVTVNDVLVGCLATNINKYFLDNQLKAPSDFMVSLPVDTRCSIEEAKGFANKFAISIFPLPTYSSDPFQTVLETHKRMNKLKTSGEAFSVRTGMRIMAFFLPSFINNFIYGIMTTKSALVLSNVSGPQTEIQIAGFKVDYLTFWPPQKDNMGLCVSIFSYNNFVRLGVESDDAILKEPEKLIDQMEDIIYSLSETVGINDMQKSD